MSRSSQKPKNDNRSTVIKGFVKPEIPNFPGNKSPVNFKPNSRLGTINRGRR
ncbi:MAG: hypothetical protein PHO75_00675 [Candidatus Shapirobacteria bacterium]|jgi:hypothetical protein|nr:hypothetical protein [Candidatus Shapirobacteria bacterium]